MPIQVVYVTAALLFAALFPVPSEFYTYLRIVAAGTFAWGAYRNFRLRAPLLPIAYALFAVVYNPVAEVEFTRQIWIGIHLAALVLLLATRNRFVE